MSFLISRFISKNHLYIEQPQNEAVIGSTLMTLLVNGETPMEEIGTLLKKLYEELPSPKRFEKNLANAILTLPLKQPLAFHLLTAIVVDLCHQQRLNVLPSLFHESIQAAWGKPSLNTEETILFEESIALISEGRASFHKLLSIANFQKDQLEEALFEYLLKIDTSNPSESTRRILFELRSLCPHNAKTDLHQHLLKGPLTTHQKNSLRSENVNQLWMELQSFEGNSLIKDLFRDKKWDSIKDLPPNKLPLFIQKCIDLKLPTKYLEIWREWIKLAPFKTIYPFIIEQLIKSKSFTALSPFIEGNQPALWKKIEEGMKKRSIDDQALFCFDALVHAPRALAQPFITQLIQNTDSIPELERIGEELCKSHFYLYPDLLLKTLNIFPGTLGIHLSDWQKEHLRQPSLESLLPLFSVLTHPKLSPRTRNEMLQLLLTHIPSEQVPLWFELLDESFNHGSLPPLFEAEKNQRFAQGIKERILDLKEPDDVLLSDLEHRDLLIEHVLNNGSAVLKIWLLEKGNLEREAFSKVLLSAHQIEPNDKTNQLIQSFIETAHTLDDLVLICQNRDLKLSHSILATLNRELINATPHSEKSTIILQFFLDNAPQQFPWEHYFSLTISDSKAALEITPQVTARTNQFELVPLIIHQLIEITLEQDSSAGTLIVLFELTAACTDLQIRKTSRNILGKVLQLYPKQITSIRKESLLSFLQQAIDPWMSVETSLLIGDLFCAIEFSPSLIECMQKYCRLLLKGHFESNAFINWTRGEIEKREKEWNAAKIKIYLELKNLKVQKSKHKKKVIDISFDARSIQRRILKEDRKTIQSIPKEFQPTLLKTIDSAPLSDQEARELQSWRLDPKRNKEFLYILIEEIAKYQPSVPYISSFKNAFCRSLIRDLLNSISDWDWTRLQTPLMDCFKANALPLNSISLMETWGYAGLAIRLATFGNLSSEERNHYLQCMNILATGIPYQNHSKPALLRAAVETVFLELVDAQSLSIVISAKSCLEINKNHIPLEEYKAFKKQCTDREKALLPQTINDPFICTPLLHKNPTLLFESLSYLTDDRIDLQGKVNLCTQASTTYSYLWEDRATIPNFNIQEHLRSDVTPFIKLVNLAKELQMDDQMDGLCSKWSFELMKWHQKTPLLDQDEKKRMGLCMLLIFKLFTGTYKKIPDPFFTLWKISRDFLCPHRNAEELIKHNQMTSQYRIILQSNKERLFSFFEAEKKYLLDQEQSVDWVPGFISSFQLNLLGP